MVWSLLADAVVMLHLAFVAFVVLGGLGVLKGRALRVDESDNGALYSEAGGETAEPLDVTLIPYYAWNNRGVGEMTVWLPRRY